MLTRTRILSCPLRFFAGSVLFLAAFAAAQTRTPAPAPAPSAQDQTSNQKQLIELLRLTPKLTTVVARDPSLLADQEYVSRSNPQLAAFLAIHPEIVRNPEFYLFTSMNHTDGSPDMALQRVVWPEFVRPLDDSPRYIDIVGPIAGMLAFLGFLTALVWLIRILIENRRWGRIFRLQSEVHGRLIDKFSSTQELATYMGTEAGKRFLEAAPIPVGFEPQQRVPNAVARVLTPLQIGIVLTLLGLGFYLLRHAGPEMDTPMLVLGTIALMPGLGFIISAGVSWVLAGRLGLMPVNPGISNPPSVLFDSTEQK